VTEELPDADTDWRVEARQLAEARAWDYFRAYDLVTVRYLTEGDSRPLLDLILRRSRAPGLPASRYIAAMIDSEQRTRLQQAEFPYVMRIVPNRGRGRPRTEQTAPWLSLGLRALAEERMPAMPFWFSLAAAIDFEGYERDKGMDFPWRAKLVRTDGRRGRPRDPGIPMRTLALATFVSEKMERGAKYEDAVEQVRADIEKQGAAEKWNGWIETQTIRDAYDGVKSKMRRGGNSQQ
jgi:hypothetical protein